MFKKLIKKLCKNNKGFTLIELIVVIAILGLLAAIAVPRLTNQTANARVVANQATARTILSAASLAEANDGSITLDNVQKYVDVTLTLGSDAPTTGTGWYLRTSDPLEVYLGTSKILP